MQSCNVRYGMAFVQHNQLKQQYKFISKQRKLYIFEEYIMDEKSQNFECVVQRSVITNTGAKRFGSELHDTIYKESLYIYGIIQFGLRPCDNQLYRDAYIHKGIQNVARWYVNGTKDSWMDLGIWGMFSDNAGCSYRCLRLV